jgi:hypothetical protein
MKNAINTRAVALLVGLVVSTGAFATGSSHHNGNTQVDVDQTINNVKIDNSKRINNSVRITDDSVENHATGGAASVGDIDVKGGHATGGAASVGDTTSNSDSDANANNGDQTTNVDASSSEKQRPVSSAFAVAGGECGTAFGAQGILLGLSGSWTGEECLTYLSQSAVCPNANLAVSAAVSAAKEYSVMVEAFKSTYVDTVKATFAAAQEQLSTCSALSQAMNPNGSESE